MKSKQLLKEFYHYAERMVATDAQLGALNSAYVQIADELDLLHDILRVVVINENGSIAFKGVSSKTNARLFKKIKEMKNYVETKNN